MVKILVIYISQEQNSKIFLSDIDSKLTSFVKHKKYFISTINLNFAYYYYLEYRI